MIIHNHKTNAISASNNNKNNKLKLVYEPKKYFTRKTQFKAKTQKKYFILR